MIEPPELGQNAQRSGPDWLPFIFAGVALAAACVCLSAAGLAYMQSGSGARLLASRNSATLPTAVVTRIAPPTPTAIAERLEIVGKPTILKLPSGIQLHGMVKNPETKPRSAVILATFRDAAGKSLGTAVGSIQNVQPNDTKTFTLYGAEEPAGYTKIDVTVQTRLPATTPGEDQIVFSGAAAKAAGSSYQIDVRMMNNDKKAHRFTVVGSLIDSAGNVAGVVRAPVANLAAGASSQLTLLSTDKLPAYSTVRVQVDILEE